MGTVRIMNVHYGGWVGGGGVRAQCAVRKETAARVGTLINP